MLHWRTDGAAEGKKFRALLSTASCLRPLQVRERQVGPREIKRNRGGEEEEEERRSSGAYADSVQLKEKQKQQEQQGERQYRFPGPFLTPPPLWTAFVILQWRSWSSAHSLCLAISPLWYRSGYSAAHTWAVARMSRLQVKKK